MIFLVNSVLISEFRSFFLFPTFFYFTLVPSSVLFLDLQDALLLLYPLLHFPLHLANPAFHVVVGADQVILQDGFGQAAVAHLRPLAHASSLWVPSMALRCFICCLKASVHISPQPLDRFTTASRVTEMSYAKISEMTRAGNWSVSRSFSPSRW